MAIRGRHDRPHDPGRWILRAAATCCGVVHQYLPQYPMLFCSNTLRGSQQNLPRAPPPPARVSMYRQADMIASPPNETLLFV